MSNNLVNGPEITYAAGGGSTQLYLALHYARVYRSTAQTITTGTTGTVLTFDAERWDTGGVHSTVSNTGRLTATRAGVYVIGLGVEWAANATGVRIATIRLNAAGTPLAGDERAASGASTVVQQNIVTLYRLAAGEYVYATVAQTSGGDLDVQRNANLSPEFWMQQVMS